MDKSDDFISQDVRYRLNIRKASLEDVENIVALVESAYRGEKSQQGWTTEADLLDGQRTDREEVEQLILQADSQIIVSELANEIVASVHIINKGDYAYIGMFAVSPLAQGEGVGKTLLDYIEDLMQKKWQVKYSEMAVITQRVELINWYLKQGYELTGEKRPFPYGDIRYGIPKRDDLEFDVLKKKLKGIIRK